VPPILLPLLAVGVGACVGSFLNVCIHRLPRRISIVAPRSACPACGQGIAWYDNVPLLSYLLLRGRCRACAAPIALTYPMVEAATALLFGLLFALRGPSPLFVAQAVFGSALIALVLIDARHQILPDAITLPGIAAGLLTSPLRDISAGAAAPAGGAVRDAFLGALLGFAIPWGINAAYRLWQAARGVPAADRQDGIGRGDFKLLSMIGAFLGIRLLLFSLFAGSIAGAAFGLIMMRRAGYHWKTKLPYGVFLGGAAILALLAGEPLLGWYLRGLLRIGP
jgi:leader peptidase (prepilin peptidase)/N-methyltransferase